VTPARPAVAVDPRWLKAVVLGSLWAAVEIILGSFLHNLRVPLSGHMLTAIAVVLLAAGHRRWPEPGLLWRAGLIAAAMKAVAPTAVLLGPMVAIAMEGFAFELGVRLRPGRRLGVAIGGAAAMSWTFLHQIGGLLLTYGGNLVRLYAGLVAYAERVLPVPLGVWGPLTSLAVLDTAVGVVAALAGWSAAGLPAHAVALPQRQPVHRDVKSPAAAPRRSLPFLLVAALALPTGMAVLGRLPLGLAALAVAVVVGLAIARYRATMRRLLRPGFWISLAVMTAAAGAVLGGAAGIVTVQGIAVGVAMSLRAVFVTTCFAALAVELTNPRMAEWFRSRGADAYLEALETAFGTLPLVVAAMPSPRFLLTRPRTALASVLPNLERWLAEAGEPPVHIVTAGRGEGKTTLVSDVVERLRSNGVRVGGVLAPGTWHDGTRAGFDVVDLQSRQRETLCSRADRDGESVGGFRIRPDGLAFARRALGRGTLAGCAIVVVDEVGPWELAGQGYAAQLDALRDAGVPLLLVVRDGLVEEVCARWSWRHPKVWQLSTTDPATLAAQLAATADPPPAPSR
jgi:nucleoside-triphosphatase THEP1